MLTNMTRLPAVSRLYNQEAGEIRPGPARRAGLEPQLRPGAGCHTLRCVEGNLAVRLRSCAEREANHTRQRMNSMSKSFMNGKRFLGSAAACLVLVGWALSASADVGCTVANWDDKEGLSDSNVGTQGADNRRYFGPCGLRVPFGGSESWLENRQDGSANPLNEASYRVRFFAFFDDLSGSAVPFFEAYDEADPAVPVFTIFFDESDGIGVDVNGDGTVDHWAPVSEGWQEIEFAYEAGGTFVFSLNGVSSEIRTSSSRNVTFVRLGDIDGDKGSGWADFDDFDSRRSSFPSSEAPVLAGDANGDGVVNIFDALALRDELAGVSLADGQVDCDGNGAVNIFDAICLRDLLQQF